MADRRRLLESTAVVLEARVAAEQSRGRLPSVVAGVVRDGELAWCFGRGTTVRRDESRRPDADTQYRIGSITKTMTAALVMQARDVGLLDLADRLDRHLPGTRFGDATIRSLLSHSSGLAAEPPGPWWERSPGREFAALSEQTARQPAERTHVLPTGRQYHYSNLAYGLLGRLVGAVTGLEWYDLLADRLLGPLGMSSTSYQPAARSAAGFSVHPYAHTLTDEPSQDTKAMAPAGQLWSTVADLARWAAFLADPDERVLSAESVAEMMIPQASDPGERMASGYGLGLRLARVGDRLLAGHTGSMPGFLAGLVVDPQSRVGAVVLANGTAGMDCAGLPTDLVTTVLDREPVPAAEWTPQQQVRPEVEDLLGQWFWGNTAHTLSAGPDGQLLLRAADGERELRFRPRSPDEYVGLDGYFTGEPLLVVRRDDGSVSHLDAATFVFTREPYDPKAPIPGGVSSPG